MQAEFNRIKKAVLSAIHAAKEEVLPTTKINQSGIYMIYINCFEDEKILPIYIGQSVNIQQRYKNHYQEILALNRLTYDEYKKYTENGFYDGSYKSCKIFRYMIEHHCELCDYHVIPLEYCRESELDVREQYYINEFKSEYFGFNQLNATTLYMIYMKARDDVSVTLNYLSSVQNNAELLMKYWGYGFTIFNYEKAFYKTPLPRIDIPDERVQTARKKANAAIVALLNFVRSPYDAKAREIEQAEQTVYEEIQGFNDLLKPIDARIIRQKQIIRTQFKTSLNYTPTKSEFDHFIKGMYSSKDRKEFNASLRKKNIHFLAYVRLKSELAELESLFKEREHILLNVEKSQASKRNILRQLYLDKKALESKLRIEHLFPNTQYPSFPLKDCRRIENATNDSILIVISNNGRISTPEATVVYCNIGDEKRIYYVKNQTTTQVANYVEHNAYFHSNSFFGKGEVYKIIPRNSQTNSDGLFCDNHISILSEYKTGINDYSFEGVAFVGFSEIMKELLVMLKAHPHAAIRSTESKQILQNVLKNALDKRTYIKVEPYLK